MAWWNKKFDEVVDDLVEHGKEVHGRSYSRQDAEIDWQQDPKRAAGHAELQRRRNEGWTEEDYRRGYREGEEKPWEKKKK